MKTYKAIRSNGQIHVTVDGKPLKTARPSYDNQDIPFSLVKNSDGARHLAFSLLADCYSDWNLAADFSWRFMDEVAEKFTAEKEVTSNDIEKFLEQCANDGPTQNCKFTPVKRELMPDLHFLKS